MRRGVRSGPWPTCGVGDLSLVAPSDPLVPSAALPPLHRVRLVPDNPGSFSFFFFLPTNSPPQTNKLQGFLHASVDKAQEYFDRASDCFRKAVKEDPNNEVYKKALEMNSKAPQLHAQIQKQLQQQQEASVQEQAKLQSASTDFLYDVAGWAILVGLGVGLVVLSSLQKPK